MAHAISSSFTAALDASIFGSCSRASERSLKAGKLASIPLKSGRSHGKLTVKAATTVAPRFTTLKPLGDRILVKTAPKEETTLGGIILPSASQTKPQGGEVVAIGEGKKIGGNTVNVSVSEGQNVIYSKFAGTELDFNGVAHLILKEDDILGVLSTDDIKDLQPLNERVLLKVFEAEDKTAGGVYLTESAKEKPVVGEVIAAGPGPLGEDGSRKGLDVSPGNNVLYSKFSGNEFKSKDGSPYVVIRASDILAVLS